MSWQLSDHANDIHWSDYEQALNGYLECQDDSLALAERYRALIEARDRFLRLRAQGDGHIATHMMLMRSILDLGDVRAAAQAAEILRTEMPWLTTPLPEDLQLQINRPFLPPTRDFDLRPVRGDLGDWLQAAVLDVFEKGRAESSCVHGDLRAIEDLAENPSRSPEMARREWLMSLRLGATCRMSEVTEDPSFSELQALRAALLH
ncbi:hypothetical protein [Thiorhodococcus minor]|uniref:hypothetical protein n=1 Tax=Thiorhodococcus minor TaxID=57489 RepID=UPI001ADADEC1|nr:hypothetical protein [Thiorhodococcus minor]